MAVVSEFRAFVGARTHTATDAFAELRRREFARLDANNHVYLDYTGAALYPAMLVERHASVLRDSILGNPHSVNPASENSAALIATARERVLEFFSADPQEYSVIFCANATAAIKLVAEGFPFRDDSELLLTADNHNSVNGSREYARTRGAKVRYWAADKNLGLSRSDSEFHHLAKDSQSLFAYPAQSNFSGVHHSLDHIDAAQRAGYQVLLDAAAFVPGYPLDLSAVHPDFVCVSFYKMFGYPTGIGALIARRKSLALLRRPWFAGGTVNYASTQHPELHQLAPDEQAFEDGSPNFTSVSSVIDGLKFLDQIGMANIQNHNSRLIDELVSLASSLKHDNGAPLVRWYGGGSLSYGSARALNLLAPDGAVIHYESVERLAGEHGISIRGGCFCNPGCAETAFAFPAAESLRCMKHFANHEFSPTRFANCLGTAEAGALRVSIGLANNESDIHRFLSFIGGFRNLYQERRRQRPREKRCGSAVSTTQ